METLKFVRKPLFVDAVKVTPENFNEVATWCKGTITSQETNESVPMGAVDPATQYIHVAVTNPQKVRQTRAFVGDWILYTDRGYKVYTEGAFLNAFEEVVGGPETVNPDQEELKPIPEDETPGENAGDIHTELVSAPGEIDTHGSGITQVTSGITQVTVDEPQDAEPIVPAAPEDSEPTQA